MAVIANQYDPDQQDKNTSQGAPTPSAPTVGGPQGGAVATPGSPGNASAPTNSGRFTNLNKYINANKDFGAAQGGLAGQIAGNINQQADAAKSDIGNLQGVFNQQAQAGSSSFSNPNITSQALSDPTQFVQNPANIAAFQAQQNASYTGPQNLQALSDSGKTLGQIQDVQTKGQQAQNESGRFNLLRSMFGNNNYSQGQQNLDNAFLQSTPGSAKQLQATKQAGSELSNIWNNASNKAAASGAQSAAQAAQIGQQSRDALLNSTTGTANDLTGRYKTFTDQAKAYNQAATSDIGDDKLSADTLAMFGLKPTRVEGGRNVAGDKLYDVNLNSYVNQGVAPTMSQFASPQDYAKYAALQQLGGQFGYNLNQNEAGTGGTGRMTVDTAGLAAALKAKDTAYQKQVSDAYQNYVNIGNSPAYRNAYNEWHNGGSDYDRGILDQSNAAYKAYDALKNAAVNKRVVTKG